MHEPSDVLACVIAYDLYCGFFLGGFQGGVHAWVNAWGGRGAWDLKFIYKSRTIFTAQSTAQSTALSTASYTALFTE